MQSNFIGMLQEIQASFQDTATPCETVEALANTIASLEQIKKGLEDTTEYRAAQAEKALTAKGDRALQLKKTLEESKAAAEKLLGYPLKPENVANGEAYRLMPTGFVDKLTFNYQLQHYQKQIDIAEVIVDRCKGELAVLKSNNVAPFGRGTLKQTLEQTQGQLTQAERSLHDVRSRLLGFVMANQPMLDATFSDQLATHLDAMLVAYMELHSEPKA